MYLRETCASCQEPLDLTQQLANFDNPSLECTRNSASDHPPLICDYLGCGRTFSAFKDLKAHSGQTRHESFWCSAEGCNARLSSVAVRLNKHFSRHHPEVLFRCAQCGTTAELTTDLDRHGQSKVHAAYACQLPGCEAKANQLGELKRHQLSHKTNVQRYSCTHCRK